MISCARAEGTPIRLVVLTACESIHTAKALISCDESTTQPLTIVCWLTKAVDPACHVFSQEFWRALDAKPGEYKAAYDLAVQKLRLQFQLLCPVRLPGAAGVVCFVHKECEGKVTAWRVDQQVTTEGSLFEHLAGNAPVNARAMDDSPLMTADWEQINIKSSGVQSPGIERSKPEGMPTSCPVPNCPHALVNRRNANPLYMNESCNHLRVCQDTGQ